MTKKKQTKSKPAAAPANSPSAFDSKVAKKLTKGPQSSGDIAVKLGMCEPVVDGNKPRPTKYGTAKVRASLQRLAEAGIAKNTGKFKTSRYTKA